MDIEDLFNEENQEESKTPLVIPEFGGCEGGQDDEIDDSGASQKPHKGSCAC